MRLLLRLARQQWITCLLIFSAIQTVEAQYSYALQRGTDLTITAVGLTTGIAGYTIGRHIKPLKPADIAALEGRKLCWIDQKQTRWLSGKADRASNLSLYGTSAAPLLLLADGQARKGAGEISILYFETLLLANGLTQITKSLVKRPRPYNYNPHCPLALKQKSDARKSFFSGHTSVSAASAFFAARVWSDLHPQNRWKPAVWTAAAGLPAVTGYLRMRAGRHFFTDVLTGYAVGALAGWLVPALH